MLELKSISKYFSCKSFLSKFRSCFTVNNLKLITLSILFLFLFTLHNEKDWHFDQRAGVFIFFSLCIGKYFYEKYGLLMGLTSAYCSISASWACFWRENKFAGLGLKQMAIHRGIFFGYLGTFLIWFIVSQGIIKKQTLAKLFIYFGIYIAVHHLFLRGYYAPDGFLMTASLASIYLVFLIPVCISFYPKISFALMPMVLIMGHVSGRLCLLFYIIGMFFMTKRKWSYVLVALCILCAALVYHFIPYNYQDQGRFEIWKMVYNWWHNQPYKLFGIGAGTAYTMVPFLQQDAKSKLDVFTYLHNEYLQVLFELGWVGLGLLVTTYCYHLYKTCKYGNIGGFAFMLSLLPACASMFPFRLEIILFLVAFNLDLVFRSNLRDREPNALLHFLNTVRRYRKDHPKNIQ